MRTGSWIYGNRKGSVQRGVGRVLTGVQPRGRLRNSALPIDADDISEGRVGVSACLQKEVLAWGAARSLSIVRSLSVSNVLSCAGMT